MFTFSTKLYVFVSEGFVETHTPQFARGNVFNQMPSPQQLQEQDQYKAYLKQQVHTCTAVQKFGVVRFFLKKKLILSSSQGTWN